MCLAERSHDQPGGNPLWPPLPVNICVQKYSILTATIRLAILSKSFAFIKLSLSHICAETIISCTNFDLKVFQKTRSLGKLNLKSQQLCDSLRIGTLIFFR